MLTKKSTRSAASPRLKKALSKNMGSAVNRRSFLKGSGLAAGGMALAGALPLGAVSKANAAEPAASGTEIKASVCTHCSVGCGVKAEVNNGVWTGQEPDFDSPFNLGGHCAKGASVREHAHNEQIGRAHV